MHVEGVWAAYLRRPARNGGPPRQAWTRQSGFWSTACLHAPTSLWLSTGETRLAWPHSAPRRVVQQKHTARMTTLACLLTACTNPAPLAQRYSVMLQSSVDAGMVYVNAFCCRQDGAREARVAPLWVARSPFPFLPAMLHAACGVL